MPRASGARQAVSDWLMFALACGSLACAGTAVRPEPDAVLVAASGSEALDMGKQSVVGHTSSLALAAPQPGLHHGGRAHVGVRAREATRLVLLNPRAQDPSTPRLSA